MYGIGLASRLTGVPVETIRIWERRYSLPKPRRSAGGHRKFTDEDIELLRALKILVDNGARIGNLVGESREALLASARALERGGEAADVEADLDDEPLDFGELVAETIAAAQQQDTDKTAQLLDRPLLHRHAREVMLGYYLPVLREVGELWHAGEITIATEHFIEKQITGRIHSVFVNRKPKDGPVAVLACAPGERHEAALLAAAVLLDLGGYAITYLGADLPVDELVRVVEAKQPRLVVVSATVDPNVQHRNDLVAALSSPAMRGATVVAGGPGARAIEDAAGERVQALSSLEQLEEIAAQIASAS